MSFKHFFSEFSWGIGGFLIAYQLILLAGLPFYFYTFDTSLGLWVSFLVLFFVTGIGITAGYHRFYSHRAYKVNKVVELVLLFFGSMALQGSVIRWGHDHRIHHRFVDKDQDPYNINRGFFFAHMLWTLKKESPIDEKVVPDLMQSRLLLNQHKYFIFWAFGSNFLMFLLVGFLLRDYMGAFVIVWWLRLFLVHHFTWFINSLAHTWGSKTYSREQSAVNNAIIALVTFGEGYHNYHHVFASDYRNGVKWYQFDPTKWLIWSLCKVGLAHDLVRVDTLISKKKIVQEDTHIFIEALKRSTSEKKEMLEGKVHELSANLTQRLGDMRVAILEYRELKKEKNARLEEKKREIKERRMLIKQDWKSWLSLGREIDRIAPLAHHFH